MGKGEQSENGNGKRIKFFLSDNEQKMKPPMGLATEANQEEKWFQKQYSVTSVNFFCEHGDAESKRK